MGLRLRVGVSEGNAEIELDSNDDIILIESDGVLLILVN